MGGDSRNMFGAGKLSSTKNTSLIYFESRKALLVWR